MHCPVDYGKMKPRVLNMEVGISERYTDDPKRYVDMYHQGQSNLRVTDVLMVCTTCSFAKRMK